MRIKIEIMELILHTPVTGIDGNERHLYMEVQTSGMEWSMTGEWMQE